MFLQTYPYYIVPYFGNIHKFLFSSWVKMHIYLILQKIIPITEDNRIKIYIFNTQLKNKIKHYQCKV